jgi:hypothetical protein
LRLLGSQAVIDEARCFQLDVRLNFVGEIAIGSMPLKQAHQA